MESANRTTYICGICNTNPDQLSHHNAHINSTTHKEKKLYANTRFEDMF